MSMLPWLVRKSKSTILDASTNSIRTPSAATTDTPPSNTSTKPAGITDSTSLSARRLSRRLTSRLWAPSEPRSNSSSVHHPRRRKRPREASSLRRTPKHTGRRAGKEERDTIKPRKGGPGPDESASTVKYSQPQYSPQAKTSAPDDLRNFKTGTYISIPQTAYSVLHNPVPSTLQTLHLHIRDQQQQRANNIHRHQSHDHESVRMASETATPPLSYAKLQEVTIAACEKALSSASTYNHAATEEWNTAIINTILGTLVSETSTASKDQQGQPQYKYVVNSTIIQHAPSSSSGSSDPAVTGRRGMHAASGAYWNNEKDGMWSYKYSAAEKKGLDVVIGILWIMT